jgi:hypothetical protein
MMVSMSLIAWLAVAALLLYFALRVAQMKRSMPFLIAYPLFVLILVGGGIAVFIGMSWVAAFLGLGKEAALGTVYGVTALSLFVLWRLARRAIARRD